MGPGDVSERAGVGGGLELNGICEWTMTQGMIVDARNFNTEPQLFYDLNDCTLLYAFVEMAALGQAAFGF